LPLTFLIAASEKTYFLRNKDTMPSRKWKTEINDNPFCIVTASKMSFPL
jgi:hypothetical protein